MFDVTGDGTNQRAAIQSAIGSSRALYFPNGTYGIGGGGTGQDGLIFDGLSNVDLVFEGGATLKKLTVSSPDQQRIATFTNCTDVRINGATIDFNNIERYGGLNFGGCNRVWIQDCYFYDSNLNASWSSYDHYAIVVQTSTDVWIERNRSKDIEFLEADNNYRVYCRDNIIEGAAGTAAISWFAVANGYYAYDYHYEDNIIIDPRKAGILFQQETGGPNNNLVKGIYIRGNQILHDNTAGTGESIAFKQQGGGTPTGNVYEDIYVEGNMVRSALTRNLNEIFFFNSQSGLVFTRGYVKGNIVKANSSTEYAVRLDKCQRFDLSGNIVEGTLGYGIATNPVDRSLVSFNQVNGASVTAYLYTNNGTANNLKFANRTDGTWNDILAGVAF
jgi:hypothetical protein